ncbi:MAG: hypothetical protein GX657_02500 [Chloroflexi bacterium]|nr:hypothetical protein [Chloroflexota bacterium]
MATRGFEFAYAFDGSTPTIVSWPMSADASGYMKGDILAADSNGRLDKVTASAGEVTAVCMQTETDAVSDDDELMVAIVTSQQVWRCSMDATSTAAKRGYTKTIDVADEHTLDADDLDNGDCALVDTGTDDEGNVLAYVTFRQPTFGNTLA